MIKVILIFSILVFSFAQKKIAAFTYFNPNISFYSKNMMMAGATVSTTKGYSSLYSNPSGLASNPYFGLYGRYIINTSKNSMIDDTQVKLDSHSSFTQAGMIYKGFALEYNYNKYAFGYGYGYANRYGLFSIGASYLYDAIDTSSASLDKYKRDKASGNFYVIGTQYQKTFVGPEDFMAVYFGTSFKSSGKNSNENAPVIVLSPSTVRVGSGVETNLGSTTILLTLDYVNEYWSSIDESLGGYATGMKWMLFDNFSISGGYSSKTFTNSTNFSSVVGFGAGIEFGLWGIGSAISYYNNSVYDISSVIYIQDTTVQLDLYWAF